MRINDVNLAHSGEVQLVVTHPGKPYSSLKSYTSLAVIPKTTPKQVESAPCLEDLTIDCHRRHKRSRQPAYILERPTDCTALIGGCIRLIVIYEGVPKPQVNWYKAVSF